MASSGAKPRARVAVVGAGWAGYKFARSVDHSKFDVQVISPRNYFLFTPLLASTAVGTLEFRCIQEPVRSIPGIEYHQAYARNINLNERRVTCADFYDEGRVFDIHYDYLVLAQGATTNTFNVPGVNEENYVYFLKQLSDARAIRNRVIECFERAAHPSTSLEEKRQLLTFVVVGGGPISVEFSAELYDFLTEDVKRWYPDLHRLVTVTLVEANKYLLGTFDKSLSEYATRLFQKRRIDLRMECAVTEVQKGCASLKDGSKLPFGLMVWSTGIKQVPLTASLSLVKHNNGRIVVDDWLRVCEYSNVFAIGDCAGHYRKPLPGLAQVANQQGTYLVKLFNSSKGDLLKELPPVLNVTDGKADDTKQLANGTHAATKFVYNHFGTLAAVGEWKGVFDSTHAASGDKEVRGPAVSGFLAFVLWRSAYWTRSVSVANKLLIPMYWFKCWLFGRDVSRF